MRAIYTTALSGFVLAVGLLGWTPPSAGKSTVDEITACIEEKDDARAFAICDAVLNVGGLSDLERGLALMGRGFVLSRMKKCDQAIVDFNAALPLFEEKDLVYTSRGACYRDMGDVEHAVADFDTAIAVDPEDASNYTARAIFYLDTSKSDRALADFDKALTLERDSVMAHHGRAVAYTQKGDNDAALAAVSAAVRLEPKNADLYQFRAEIELLNGQSLAAASDAEKAIVLEPESVINHLTRAAALFVDGDYLHAVKDAEEGARRNPRNALAQLWIALLNGRLQNRAAPPEETSKDMDAASWPASILRLYQGKGGEQEVRAEIDASDAGDRRTRACEADFYLAEWDRNQGRTEAARQKLERVRDTCPIEQLVRALAIVELRRL